MRCTNTGTVSEENEVIREVTVEYDEYCNIHESIPESFDRSKNVMMSFVLVKDIIAYSFPILTDEH